jgi:transposase
MVLGRKNYLFHGSDAGGARAAAIYGLLGTAKLNGLKPEAYLREVLSRIADHPIKRIDELLPWNLAAGLAGNSRHTA